MLLILTLLYLLIGSFGNGVLSYFTFLKWLLQLNIYIFIMTLCFVIIPQAISTGKELPLNQTPQNVSNTTISSSSSAIEPTTLTASPAVRRRRDVALNATDGEESDRNCDLVKPNDYSLYTNKPFAQLLTDFFSGIVSRHVCQVRVDVSRVCFTDLIHVHVDIHVDL